MKYLWIGLGNSPEKMQELTKRGAKILSAEISNDALVAGLDLNGVVCDTINVTKIPGFNKKEIDGYVWSRTGESLDVNVKYRNIKYLSVISEKFALNRQVKSWLNGIDKNEDITVFVYSMHSPFMNAAATIKKHHKNTKIVLIVPDLPQYMDFNMSFVKKILKKIDWLQIKKLNKKVDKFVLYTKNMAKFLKLPNDSWIVVEGSYDQNSLLDDEIGRCDSTKAVMYSGVLDLRYGIKELVEAFELLDEDYELWLTGNGNAVPFIESKAKENERIKYFGYLPTRRDLLVKQNQATMLISTRNPEEEASKYCFPSKIFEYMLSGNPVISTRIAGIPKEYFDFLIPIDTVTSEEIAKTIKLVAEKPLEERKNIGLRGKKFVIENKSNVAQTKKILAFLGIKNER